MTTNDFLKDAMDIASGKKQRFQLRDTVYDARKNKFYVVDTSYVFNGEYETMVFHSDPYGNVQNYGVELDFERYFSEEDARTGHEKYVNEWGDRI